MNRREFLGLVVGGITASVAAIVGIFTKIWKPRNFTFMGKPVVTTIPQGRIDFIDLKNWGIHIPSTAKIYRITKVDRGRRSITINSEPTLPLDWQLKNAP